MKTRILVFAFALLAAACSRVTQDNFEKLKSGMTYEQVAEILGRPAQCSEELGIKHCVWGDDQHQITANFLGGQAVLFGSQNIR